MASFRLTTWWQIHGSLSSQEQQAHRTWKPRQSHRHAGSRWNFLIQEKRRHPSRTPNCTQDGRKLECALFTTLLSIAFLHLVIPIIMVVESGASREPRRKRAKACSNLDGNGMLKGGDGWLEKNVNVFSKMSRWRQNSCVRVRIWHWTQRNWWNNIQYLGIGCSA